MNTHEIIHDIRNPLNNIAMNAELGKLILQQGGDQQKALAAFEKILTACRSCSEQLTELKQSIDLELANNNDSTSHLKLKLNVKPDHKNKE